VHLTRLVSAGLLIVTSLVALVACDGKPSIAITTALPIKAPTGQNEYLMHSMCEPVADRPNEHIKVIWVRSGPHGAYRGRAFTRTYFCSEVLKKNFKALP
jgi:hypothetical protein